MTPKKRKILLGCVIVMAVCMVVYAISTVMNVVHNGWDTVGVINFVPFIGFVPLIVILANDKKGDKQ